MKTHSTLIFVTLNCANLLNLFLFFLLLLIVPVFACSFLICSSLCSITLFLSPPSSLLSRCSSPSSPQYFYHDDYIPCVLISLFHSLLLIRLLFLILILLHFLLLTLLLLLLMSTVIMNSLLMCSSLIVSSFEGICLCWGKSLILSLASNLQ